MSTVIPSPEEYINMMRDVEGLACPIPAARRGVKIGEYASVLGLPHSIDRSIPPAALMTSWQDKVNAIHEKYAAFCKKRSLTVADSFLQDAEAAGTIKLYRDGNTKTYEVTDAFRALTDRPGITDFARDELFWGNGVGTINRLNVAPFDVLSGANMKAGEITDIQSRRASAYAERSHLEELFPSKAQIIDNYERLKSGCYHLKGDAWHEANKKIKAFTKHCGEHGIPEGFDIEHACASIGKGEHGVFDAFLPSVEKSVETIETAVMKPSWTSRVTEQFANLHPTGKAGVIGGGLLLAGGIGYWALRDKHEKQPAAEKSAVPPR